MSSSGRRRLWNNPEPGCLHSRASPLPQDLCSTQIQCRSEPARDCRYAVSVLEFCLKVNRFLTGLSFIPRDADDRPPLVWLIRIAPVARHLSSPWYVQGSQRAGSACRLPGNRYLSDRQRSHRGRWHIEDNISLMAPLQAQPPIS